MPIRDKHKKSDAEQHLNPGDEKSSHSSDGHDESNWLVSYADMMTLLCGFFIMLFSMAKMDTPEYDSFKEALVKQFGGKYESPTQDLKKLATQVIQELGMGTSTVVKADSSGISISFESTVFFDTLSADVTPQGRTVLLKIIEGLKTRQKTNAKLYKIVIEGHTDGRPIVGGVYPSNWELSGARAARVIRLFLENGFSSDHLTAIGYADTHPQVPARNADGKWDEQALAKNRRVVLRVLDPRIDSIPFPDDAKVNTSSLAPPAVTVPPSPGNPANTLSSATSSSPVLSGAVSHGSTSLSATSASVTTANTAH